MDILRRALVKNRKMNVNFTGRLVSEIAFPKGKSSSNFSKISTGAGRPSNPALKGGDPPLIPPTGASLEASASKLQ